MHGIILIAWHIQHFGSHNHELKKTSWAVFYSLSKHQSCQACHLVVQKVRQMLYIQFNSFYALELISSVIGRGII